MANAASAGSLQAVYDTALRGVQETLNVERASLLAFDVTGTMRFVAWSGLSDEYRAAVDGHSPWSVNDTAATPVLVSDIERDASVALYAPIFRRESIRALAFIPVQFGTRLLGKFMLYYREPHTFSDAEIAIAEQIADHVAFALEHHRVAVALESRLVVERDLRQQAETDAAVREANERRLSLALAAGRMGAWDWDIGSGRVSWSSELERVHGLEPGTFAGTFEGFRRDVYPADADRLGKAIAGVLAAPDTNYDVEYRILRRDGTLRWLHATGRVLTDSGGRPDRMVGVCRDVTERKRAEEASAFLANASQVLAMTLAPEAIIENLARLVVPPLADWCIVQVAEGEGVLHPVEIAHLDGGQTSLMWDLLRRWPNRPDQFGWAEAVASSGRSVLIPRIADHLLRARSNDDSLTQILKEMRLHSAITVPLQARGRTLGTLTLMSAESERVYAESDLHFAEEIASLASLAIDNAQLYRQAEEARVVAEIARGQLEVVARVTDQIAVSLDPDEALRQLAARVVPAFADYCVTYAADERGIRPLGCAHRDPAKRPFVEALAHSLPVSIDDQAGPGMVIRHGEPCLVPVFSFAAPGPLSPGDVRVGLEPRSIMTVPLKARGRTLGAITLVATSDSARRFDEGDLSMAVELANRAALFVDNARLYTDARTAIRSRDEMVAFVSHDLRDPLQSISAATASLRLEPQSDDNSESIESIARASTQMHRLVQDLLDVSLLEAGRLPINREPVELLDLMLELQKMVVPQLKASGAGLDTRLAPDLPVVSVDRHRILAVLLNLVGNALKFGAAGGVVTVGAERTEGAVRLWVEDTGSGISPEQIDRVFDRFWRATSSGGAGLGLAVAKGIVEAHGGRIGVTSQIGVGSTFFFTLPLHAIADAALTRERRAPGADARVAPHNGSHRVLLVDDDQDVVRSLVRLVRTLGHDIQVAFSGEEALQVAEQFRPQIVLMDIGLPGLSGYDAAREMRSKPWAEGISLVAVTGWARDADRRRALEAGFDRHLTKPVGADVLEALLNESAAVR
jgi:PAS domain S-box-containing protein